MINLLREETIEKMKEVMNLQNQLKKSLAELDELVLQDTNEDFAVCNCTPYPNIQFCKVSTHMRASEVHTLLSDANVRESWADEEAICYSFDIQDVPCCILLRKE